VKTSVRAPRAATFPVMTQRTPAEDEIRRRAHELWQRRGTRPGSAVGDWLEAERQLLAEAGPAERRPAASLPPPPPALAAPPRGAAPPPKSPVVPPTPAAPAAPAPAPARKGRGGRGGGSKGRRRS
jgi:hypothetical protein